VVRFNGRSFTVFDRQNTPGVELSGILSILAEADGAMLFGTASDGVYRYHKGAWQPLGGADARQLSVVAMLRDHDGSLWIATNERLLRLSVSGVLEDASAAMGLPVVPVTALRHDPSGGMLIATEVGIFRLAQQRLQPWRNSQAWRVRDLVDDGAGGWVVAADDGIHWLHGNGRVEHLKRGERVDAVRRDAAGALWMSLSAGRLERYADGVVERLPVHGQVSPALMIDREGLVWSGSTDGLFRIDEGAASGLTVADGLRSNYIRAVMQTPDGAIWIGHSEGLERQYNGQLAKVPLLADAQRDASVLALAQRDQTLWVGTYNQGVFALDSNGRIQQRVTLPGLVQPLVRALLAEADGTVWIGCADGLYRYRHGSLRHYGTLDGLPPAAAVHALYRDQAGVLWIGTSNGMASLDAAQKLRVWPANAADFPARYVFDFLGDANGDLWIATDHGLLRRRGLSIQAFDHARGLPRDKIFRILDDGQNHLWLSSNQGVFRLDRNDLVGVAAGARAQLAVHVVDHTDGMPSRQTNGASSPSSWMTGQGQLLFATSGGLAVIDPQRVGQQRLQTAPVAIESVIVDGAQQQMRERYQLPSEVERIGVAYSGLGFRAPDKMRYRYRLEGFDADWVDADTRTEAVYTNLPPGSYRLRIQAMALPLDWADAARIGETVLTLEVATPYWRRPWALALLALALIGLVVALISWRTASYRRRQRQLDDEIAVRTQELSEKNRALEQADAERDALLKRLAHQATHDALTGLPNRRAADAHLQLALRDDPASPLTVALVDIDHFKRINDVYGHEVGDRVLRDVAWLLQLQLGEGQFISRHGGEEFLIVLRGMGLSEALPVLQALRTRVARLRLEDVDAEATITVSIGAAERGPEQETTHTLIAAADRQLYRAKNTGRNRVLS
jgi:diguanylate cyclase (GGDEF)-like protein